MNHAIEILYFHLPQYIINDIDKYMGHVCQGIFGKMIVWRNFNGRTSRPHGDCREFLFDDNPNSEYRFIRNRKDGMLPDNTPDIVGFRKHGTLCMERWVQKGLYHKDDAPAVKIYNFEEAIHEEIWYYHDKLHNSKGPAQIQYYNNGNIWWASYWQHGMHHRKDAPAYIQYSSQGDIVCQIWVENNKIIKKHNMELFSAPPGYCQSLRNVGIKIV